MLFPDRVTRLTGEPGAMGLGAISTETEIRPGSWFLHAGRVPPGILVEAGQADLFLISWLGIDFHNRGTRVYRMLGCDLTFVGSPPRVGDKVTYDIEIDQHAEIGGKRLFFFRFDCHVGGTPHLRMRNGQAGFFTDQELAEAAGVLWDPAAEHPQGENHCAEPPIVPRAAFTAEEVAAFAAGRAFDAFGPGYEATAAHTATPQSPAGRLGLLGTIEALDPAGGPWQRGYMRVLTPIAPEDWFFQGHFLNDPCMPGTLMIEAGFQAMAFYLAALGYTRERDGWRFEPVPEETFALRCRGQVLPSARELRYEVFVHALVDGPVPSLYADILGTVDGSTKAVHARRLGLRLVPDWPLETAPEWLEPAIADRRPPARFGDLEFGRASMLACALGRPSAAFGALYRRFDGPFRTARLPAPPYLFMSRVTRLDSPPGALQAGVTVEADCDCDPDAWYHADSPSRLMPFCVLMEAGLQPCGWLASYVGLAGAMPEPLFFRNLDGTATVHAAVPPNDGSLVTRARLTSVSQSGGIILVHCEVECRLADRLVLTMRTGFGFFPKAALAAQAGLPPSATAQPWPAQAPTFDLDLTQRPPALFEGPARLPAGKLLMLDRITGLWRPTEGSAGARIRAEKTVDPRDWFFKAHFFQDPVMPGSLGLEAMLQTLQAFMLLEGLHGSMMAPRFEAQAVGVAITWKYRGQVTPASRLVVIDLAIKRIVPERTGVVVTADGALFVDGTRIYDVRDLAMRLVETAAPANREAGFTLDPAVDVWLQDHRPNHILPVLPMMGMIDHLARAAGEREETGRQVVGLRQLRLHRWAIVDGPRRFRTRTQEQAGVLQAALDMQDPGSWADAALFRPVAEAEVMRAEHFPPPPAPLPPLLDAVPAEDPYRSGAVTHGPSFHLLRSLRYGRNGASATLDAAAGRVPIGRLHPALLDAALHALANDAPHRWHPSIPEDRFMLPCGLDRISLHAPTPVAGLVDCEIRFDGYAAEQAQLAFRIQLFAEGRLWADFRSLHRLLPRGRIGNADDVRRLIEAGLQCYLVGESLMRQADVAQAVRDLIGPERTADAAE